MIVCISQLKIVSWVKYVCTHSLLKDLVTNKRINNTYDLFADTWWTDLRVQSIGDISQGAILPALAKNV